MRHRRKGRKLNRNASHRLALFRNLSRALITHESIQTTLPKAKELRSFFEKLVTLAKNAAVLADEAAAATDEKEVKRLKAHALHLRRLAMARLGPMHGTGVYDKEGNLATGDDTVLKKLFNQLGPRFKLRPGGYTRVLKLHYRRLGDAGATGIIELMKEGEKKVQVKEKKPQVAPAPVPVTE